VSGLILGGLSAKLQRNLKNNSFGFLAIKYQPDQKSRTGRKQPFFCEKIFVLIFE